ncbi:universal stress protein [Agromyces sp. SYSU T0242]|uniref:universal stress protein n=1 Tax=Agromyces litoreus TaxID=3158561 RepID=UPI0033960A9A
MSAASILVGYTADEAGADALAVAGRVAAATGAGVEVVLVLPSEARNSSVPADAGYERFLRERSRSWLADASGRLGTDVATKLHLRYAESSAEGLIDAAHEFGAALIVVGTARGGILGRSRIGSVADALLHSSDVPVLLAPAGSEASSDEGVTRITAAVGTRPGADALLESAVRLARSASAPLRLLSLVPIDLPAGLDAELAALTSTVHAEDVLDEARRALPVDLDASVETADGSSIEGAVRALDWHPGEVVLVGSSRLAAPRRLFLGSTAAKMLRELPVPMIVVPRTTRT